jgi:hypothetical protein
VARYESLRDRLPLLYRPDADDAVAPLLPLGRDDITELGGDAGPIRFKATQRGDGSLIVTLSEPGPVRRLALTPGRAPGSGFALEIRAVETGGALSLAPLAVLAVSDSVAPVGVALPGTFAVQLKQRSLLGLQLLSVAGVLERLNREAGDVMQSHWFTYADRALNSPFFLRSLALQKLGMPAPHDPPVRHFPYIDDLGRLASLLSLPPWQEPVVQDGGVAANPETVETYRQRIGRIVALYTNGLGTVDAMRRITEAQLPIDVDAAPEQQDRPFSIEEFAALTTSTLAVELPGQPTDYVGPLMHWPVTNDGLLPAAPTVVVTSPSADELVQVDADGDPVFAATATPLLELYRGGALRIGLAYSGTVPPSKTLRIQPAHDSWLAVDAGILTASAGPGEDPTAPGPWKASQDGPGDPVPALLGTGENALWAGLGTGELWRFDGAWTTALSGQPPIRCLAEDGLDLLLGTETAFVRVPRFPEGAFTAAPGPGDGRAVNALLHAADGTWWIGTSKGLSSLKTDDSLKDTKLTAEVKALAQDSTGAIYAGGDFGLVAYRPDTDEWWLYSGEAFSDEVSEWLALDPAKLDDSHVFLPSVTSVLRARDGALWIGTAQGLARYVARGEGGPVAFRTQLEAFPDLCPGVVSALAEDERGLLWAATDRGVFRFDGRDVFQFQTSAKNWVQFGRADSIYPPAADPRPRGAWRFRRAGAAWERFDDSLASPDWVAFSGAARTKATEKAVYGVAFTDSLAADIVDAIQIDFKVSGTSTTVDPSQFVSRVKLDGDTRVVAGGIPALPRLPAGTSEWRYLSLEPGDATLPASRPAWTIEGRLLPADAKAPDPEPGRYDQGLPEPLDEESEFDEAVFAFPPAARVGFAWDPKHPLSVEVRLGSRGPNDSIDPAALDRVFDGMRQVRPAGVRAVLAVGEKPVRKES